MFLAERAEPSLPSLSFLFFLYLSSIVVSRLLLVCCLFVDLSAVSIFILSFFAVIIRVFEAAEYVETSVDF